MIITVSLDRIQPNPWQTRVGEPDPEYIKALALDIAANGLLQNPIGRLVTDMGEGVAVPVEFGELGWNAGTIEMKLHEGNALCVQLCFGHNRLAAFKWLEDNNYTTLEFKGMPVDIRMLDDQQMAIMAWSENEKRRDVSPIERAKAIERRMTDFGWSQQEVADQLGLARPTVSNILRLLKLPEKIQVALHAGDMSARVASALLPMYELPQHTIDEANSGYYARPRDAEEAAMEGESSDAIRDKVEAIYRLFTRPLQKAEFKLDELFPEGTRVLGYDHNSGGELTVYCGLCRTCDKRLKDTGNICLDLGCYEAKTTLHRRMYLANAAGACGIEVVDPNKGGQVTVFSAYQTEKTEQIIASKCENLRLIYTESTQKDLRHVTGHPHAMIVCDKRNASCTCLKGLELAGKTTAMAAAETIQREREEDPEYEDDYGQDEDEETDEQPEPVRAQTTAPDPKQLEELARQARRAKMDVSKEMGAATKKVIAVLADALAHDEPGAFMLVARGGLYGRVDDSTLTDYYRRIAGDLTYKILPNSPNSIDELYEVINQKLRMLQLEPVHYGETLVEKFENEDLGQQ